MALHKNPALTARLEIETALIAAGLPRDKFPEMLMAVDAAVEKALSLERLLRDQHEDCGADNPEGKAELCKCYCHKGHFKHVWTPVIKTPALNTDGTYHLLDRCKYCPDMRLKVIKTGFIGEKHQLISLEYLIRGEQRVLSKEEWFERKPAAQDSELLRRHGL